MKKSIQYILMISFVLILTSCINNRKAPVAPDSGLEPGSTIAALPKAPVAASSNASHRIMPLKPVVLAISSGKISDINLTIPTKFSITRPSEPLKTTYEKYFITGLSDPQKPVYFEDEEIERLGTKGAFGVFVALEPGENTFTFSQDGKSQTVTITRNSNVPSASIPITEITQSSMVPSVFSGAKVGESLTLGCIAPSGASVTAEFGGKTVKLKQAAVTEKDGVPAFFTGTMPIDADNYDSDVTQNAGKVAYVMDYGDESKKYESTGDVYIAGENSDIAVHVKEYMAFVYPKSDLNDLPDTSEKLKQGATDYVKSQGNSYVELRSGGFAAKNRLEIIEGKVNVDNEFSKVRASYKSRNETYTFTGTSKPAYLTELSGGKFTITFFNTTGAPEPSISGSKLFSDVAVSSSDTSTTYTFTQLQVGNIWGYNINYSGKNTILTFNYKPSLRSGSRPLEDITIILDPGHGGNEPGAAGIANYTGPAEADINLAHAYAARDVLASMGANVLFTRPDDVYLDLDARLKSPEATKADMFISLHHNSMSENSDTNNIAGMEIYYHTSMSKKFAGNIMTSLAAALDRTDRKVEQSYYRVTLSPYAPSLLVELGFISNPLEYELSTDDDQINKAAKAIADGVLKTLS